MSTGVDLLCWFINLYCSHDSADTVDTDTTKRQPTPRLQWISFLTEKLTKWLKPPLRRKHCFLTKFSKIARFKVQNSRFFCYFNANFLLSSIINLIATVVYINQ